MENQDQNNSQTNFTRQTALKVFINEILNGEYVRQEGFNPNYVLTNKKKISRVNLMGVIVEKIEDETYNEITVEDKTGKISIRDFEKKISFNSLEVGQIVNLIGKPKEFQNSRYILLELIKVVTNTKELELRNKEIEKYNNLLPEIHNLELSKQDNTKSESSQNPEEIAGFTEVEEENIVDDTITEQRDSAVEKIITLIKELDTGDGANIEEVIENSTDPNCEAIIKNLLEAGEVFELKPGIIKVI